MLKKISFVLILILLAWASFISPNIKEVASGVAILLFGMILLEKGFHTFVDGPLKKLLTTLTNKWYKALGVGFSTTVLLQSSSLISVIAISFLSAGLIKLGAGIAIVFGSNLGTTASSWLVTIFGLKLEVSNLAMPLLAFGILFVLQKSKHLKGIGRIIAGLGFFFLGIHFMKAGFDTYQEQINLTAFSLDGFWGLIVFTGLGVLITIIMQSSSAAMALILTALAASQVTYENALSLAIGSNIGTTVTALLGAISTNVDGKRLAGAHFIFNVAIGLLAFIFIPALANLVDFVSVQFGIALDNYTYKLTLFHTIF